MSPAPAHSRPLDRPSYMFRLLQSCFHLTQNNATQPTQQKQSNHFMRKTLTRWYSARCAPLNPPRHHCGRPVPTTTHESHDKSPLWAERARLIASHLTNTSLPQHTQRHICDECHPVQVPATPPSKVTSHESRVKRAANASYRPYNTHCSGTLGAIL
jgi:hypothetical protein